MCEPYRQKFGTRFLVQAAVIAAIYTVLTLLVAPIAFGPVQFRISEALTILPIFSAAAIPGLTVGCILANLFGGFGIYDIVFGSLATLLAGICTYLLRKKPYLATLPPVLFNAIIVGPMLYFVVPDSPALLVNIATVGLGELGACVVLGIPLILLLKKYPKLFR